MPRLIIFLLAAAVIFYAVRKYGKANAPPQPAGPSEDRRGCPYCEKIPPPPPLSGTSLDLYEASYEKIEPALAQAHYSGTLERIEQLLPVAPWADHRFLASYAAAAFEGLCRGKSVPEATALYAHMKENSPVIRFALGHGMTDRITAALVQSLRGENEEGA